jgi:hypothetical protein
MVAAATFREVSPPLVPHLLAQPSNSRKRQAYELAIARIARAYRARAGRRLKPRQAWQLAQRFRRACKAADRIDGENVWTMCRRITGSERFDDWAPLIELMCSVDKRAEPVEHIELAIIIITSEINARELIRQRPLAQGAPPPPTRSIPISCPNEAWRAVPAAALFVCAEDRSGSRAKGQQASRDLPDRSHPCVAGLSRALSRRTGTDLAGEAAIITPRARGPPSAILKDCRRRSTKSFVLTDCRATEGFKYRKVAGSQVSTSAAFSKEATQWLNDIKW